MIITNHHTDYELVALQEEVHMDGDGEIVMKYQIQQNKTSQKPFSDGKGKGADPVHADPGIHSKKSKNNSPRRNSFRKNIVDGMALEKEKQEINNVKNIKGNQDAQKSFLIIFCEAEVLLRGIGETGTG